MEAGDLKADPGLSKDRGLLEILVRAARTGERVFTETKGRRSGQIRTKSSCADLVTEVDLRVQEAVMEFLRGRLPHARVVAEESGVCGVEGDTIYLDPIDGTLNFVHGFGEHCISIGYWRGDKPVAGVVLKPGTGDLYTASEGRGAFRNGEPIRVSPQNALRDGLLSTGWPYDKSQSGRVLSQMGRFIGHCQEIRIIGSAALAMCYVASGVLEGFWETGLEPWDLAAGTLIALEAGASVTAQDGKPFRLEAGDVLASNGHLHGSMMRILSTT
jgi:myo-inositol-1(or 4)-monophosphatase